MGRKSWIALGIGIGIFFILLWHLDFFDHWKDLANTHLGWLAASLSLLCVHQMGSYSKWKVMYRTTIGKEKQPLMPIYASILVSGMITPARSGDVLASLSWRGIQGKVLAWSIFNRISEGVMTIVLSLFILGVFFQSSVAQMRWVFISFLFILVVLLIVFVFNRNWGLFFFHQVRAQLQNFKSRPWIAKLMSYEKKIENQIEFFYETMEQFQKKNVLSVLIGFTFWNRSMIILMNMAMLQALGIKLPWTQVLGILAATWVSVFLSPIPGGFGIGDVAPSLMLSSFGYKNQAANFIVINHVIDLVLVFFWTMMWGKSLKLKKEAPSSRELNQQQPHII